MKLEGTNLHIGPKNSIKSIEPVGFNPEYTQIHKGWRNDPFEFLNPKRQKTDGCLFTIEPAKDKKLNSIFVVRSLIDVTFQEAIQKGAGYWLAQSPKGDVIAYEVNEENLGTVIEWNGKGWINTWIAKAQGAEVVDITEPRFILGQTEEELSLEDLSITLEFRKTHQALINQDITLLKELGIIS